MNDVKKTCDRCEGEGRVRNSYEPGRHARFPDDEPVEAFLYDGCTHCEGEGYLVECSECGDEYQASFVLNGVCMGCHEEQAKELEMAADIRMEMGGGDDD